MIFDSVYDTYRGVVTYVRVVDGELNHRERIAHDVDRATHELLEVGVISPSPIPSARARRRRGRLPHHRREGRAPAGSATP
jgi:translation elongation factor EF-4